MRNFIGLLKFSIYLGVLLSIVGCSNIRPSSDLFKPIIKGSPIPKGYETYTLFLVPSYSLKSQYKKQEWSDLMLAFESLGKSIGTQNAAIWFFNSDRKTTSIERARSIVDQINSSDARNQFDQLKYEMAPIIVFMNYNPESYSNDKKRFFTAIHWKSKNPKLIINFMDELAQLIRNNNVHFGTLENKQMVIEFYQFLSKLSIKVNILKNFLVIESSDNTTH